MSSGWNAAKLVELPGRSLQPGELFSTNGVAKLLRLRSAFEAFWVWAGRGAGSAHRSIQHIDQQMNSRLDNFVSWLAAAAVVTAGVVIALWQEEQAKKPRPACVLPRATPAQEPLELQRSRASERGRGRRARAPSQIPWRGWKDIASRVLQEIQDDRIMLVAAGVTFYSLLSLFPAIGAGVSCYALVSDASTIAKHLSLVAGVVPTEVLDMLRDEITRIASKSDNRLTFGFLLGLGIALWSANAGMKAVFDALNIIYDETEQRSLVRLNLESLLFTLCSIAAALLALSAVVAFPLLTAALGRPTPDKATLDLLRWPVMLVLMIAGLAVLYRYGPSRRRAKWRWISVGSIFAGAGWLAVSSLFSWYLGNFANYNATYGTLGAVVGLMMWVWLSTLVVLVGAEINSEIEHQTGRDSTIGTEKPLGARGAVMADTVGAARF
jgi:membrane protein